ncbi:auxin-induced protein 5ng4, partial [Trifolium pratense]
RLVGMVLIIVGLYYFLWGKRNEIPQLPQSNVAAAALSTSMVDDPVVAQSTVCSTKFFT